MSTYPGLDIATCPTPAQYQDLVAGGEAPEWLGVYLGAPGCTPSPVTAAQFDALRAAAPDLTYRFLWTPHSPPYATGEGTSNAQAAFAAAGALGVDLLRVYVDIEAGWWGDPANVLQFLLEFNTELRAQGAVPSLYTSPAGITNSASLGAQAPGFVWVAEWTDVPETDPAVIPGIPNGLFAPPQRAWQYQGGTALPGATYDLSVAEDQGDTYPAPAPTPPGPEQLVAGTEYLTPKGDVVTFT